jgi:hypothetical protein
MITVKPGTLIVPGTARASQALTQAVRGVIPLLTDAGMEEVECYAVCNTRGVVAMYTVDTRDFPEEAEALVLQGVPWAAKVGGPPACLSFLAGEKLSEVDPNEDDPFADN